MSVQLEETFSVLLQEKSPYQSIRTDKKGFHKPEVGSLNPEMNEWLPIAHEVKTSFYRTF